MVAAGEPAILAGVRPSHVIALPEPPVITRTPWGCRSRGHGAVGQGNESELNLCVADFGIGLVKRQSDLSASLVLLIADLCQAFSRRVELGEIDKLHPASGDESCVRRLLADTRRGRDRRLAIYLQNEWTGDVVLG